jgi:hypothetical protein
MSIGINKKAFWAELDQAGADEVRVRLATKIYGELNERGALAREWLLRHDQLRVAEAARRQDDFAGRQLDIARGVATAATRANYISIAALVVALVALIYSIFKPI